MSTDRSKRGRPRGSGKKDEPHLMQVAELMARDPSLKATTAMKRVINSRRDWRETDATLLRRLQAKWLADDGALLARARRMPEPTMSAAERGALAAMASSSQMAGWASFTSRLTEQLKAISAFDHRWKEVASREISEATKALLSLDMGGKIVALIPDNLAAGQLVLTFDQRLMETMQSPAYIDAKKFATSANSGGLLNVVSLRHPS